VSDVRKLTPKQQRFIEEYLKDLNATQAAIRAGYNPKRANKTGPENVVKRGIAEAIQKAIKKRSDRTQITTDQVVREWALIALSDMADYVRFGEDGNAWLDFSNMPDGATRVISEIVQEEFVDGRGEESRPVRKTKFKLHNKLGALESLAKHLGMFVEQHEITETTPDERRKRITELRAKLARGRG